MVGLSSVCVYCGSGSGVRPAYARAARGFGAILAREGLQLVYGGGGIGLMGEVARGCLEGGGRVLGIIPEFLASRESALDTVQETLVVPDMHTRKRLMFERADGFVALPGGVGTLEELVEQLTWAQLGRHGKPVVLLDVEGFWRPFLDLVAHMRVEGFVRPGWEVCARVAGDGEDALRQLREGATQLPPREALRGEAVVAARM